MAKFFKPILSMAERAVRINVNELLFQILSDTTLQVQILDLNTESQLYEQGINSEGDQIGEYSMMTKAYWKPLAASEGRDGRTDHITLKDTGEFYASFRFVNDSDGFTITANTLKEDGNDLAVIYGSTILGLSSESMAEIRPELRERLVELSRKAITG
ncbi:MAG: hypothetical protein FGM16_06840 [Flavobacterium sp.]|jgi:hypothetical protein|nr:hypothetical protein [Flavobacterium sp.]